MEWVEGLVKKGGCKSARSNCPRIPGFSSPRALSPQCKAPASNTSAVMLLWPWVRPGPWCLKTSPASVLSLSAIGRTLPQRVGMGVLWGNLTSLSSQGVNAPRAWESGIELGA